MSACRGGPHLGAQSPVSADPWSGSGGCGAVDRRTQSTRFVRYRCEACGMELFSERLRQDSLATAEAQGESFWTDEIPQAAGIKLAFASEDLPTEMSYSGSANAWGTVQHIAQRSMGTTQRLSPSEAWARGAAVPTAMTYLEAAVVVLGAYCDTGECPGLTRRHVDEFIDWVNAIFRSHRVSYELVQEQIVPLRAKSCTPRL